MPVAMSEGRHGARRADVDRKSARIFVTCRSAEMGEPALAANPSPNAAAAGGEASPRHFASSTVPLVWTGWRLY
jgi:hypothetical protein